jgi:hypothetical protein
MPRFQKPALPVLNYSHPLTRELLYTTPAGWDRGIRSTENTVTRSSKNLVEGVANGAPPVLGVARVSEFGWGLCSSNNSWYQYTAVAVPTLIGSGGLTVAALVQPLVIPAIGTFNRRVIQKRASGAATDPGVDMFLDSFISYSWSFEWSDGVNEQTLRGGVPELNKIALLVGTIEPQGSIARLYVDGAQVAEAALLLSPVNPVALPISICGGIGPAGDQGGDNCVSFAAIWNRALRPREVADLWADPYRMFRS